MTIYSSDYKTASGAEFYECASVDTTNHTWTGYKAVLNNGVYSFESTATTGLAYTSVTPVVGQIYSADALITASYLYGQFVGYTFMRLADSISATAGDRLSSSLIPGYMFTTVGGYACMQCNGQAGTFTLDSSYTTSSGTFSFWVYGDRSTLDDNGTPFMLHGYRKPKLHYLWNGQVSYWRCETNAWYDNVASAQQWVHFAIACDGGTLKLYVNGSLTGYSYTYTAGDPLTSFSLGAMDEGQAGYHYYIADLRMWNTTRNASQIAQTYSNGIGG